MPDILDVQINTDIDECLHPELYTCFGDCRNLPDSYECRCPKGSHSADPYSQQCIQNFPLPAQIVVGMCTYIRSHRPLRIIMSINVN